MPKITAFAKIFRDWEGLIGACLQNVALLLGLEGARGLLEANLAEARQLKIQQEDLEGQRKAVTQRLGVVIEEGRENARKLRGHVLAQLGSRSEQLTQFGLTPIRKGGRRKPTEKKPRAAAAGGGASERPDAGVAITRRHERCRRRPSRPTSSSGSG